MSNTTCAPILADTSGATVTTARLCQQLDDGWVLLEGKQFGRARARLATPDYEAVAGDRVLVATDEGANRYVIGVLSQLRPVFNRPGAATADGTRATVEVDERGREVLRITDGQGQLLVEHCPDRRTTVVTAPGDHLELRAAGKLRLAGGEGVEIASPGALDVQVGSLGVATKHAAVEADDVDLTARTVTTTAERVRSVAHVLELRIHRIVERAHEVFRDVEGLAQTRAGRLKLVADHALQLVGRHAELRAREDVKVKGDRIYLG